MVLDKFLVLFLLSSSLAHAEDTGVFPNAASVAETHNANPSDALLYQLKESMVKVSSTVKSGGHGYGTGIAISKDHVVTNCHVLQDSNGMSITKWGEAFAPVAMIADWEHDICIMRFEWANLKPVQMGDSETLRYEQPIISISMPGDSPAPYVTLGKIKALYPFDGANVMRASAAFAIGASGSPVFDYDGKLIAISTLKSPGQKAYFYNMPIKWAKELLTKPEIPLYQASKSPFWDAPDEARPFFMRVVLPYQNGHWAELKTVAENWLKQEPNSTEALYYLGIAEQNLGNVKAANQYYQQVLKQHPNHPATLIALGLMANKAGNLAEVEKTHIALKAIDSALDEEFIEALKQ
ncbi:MAG: serine protease [Methylotenera sp.]|nr:MAG: serine protease [Methylotenera sp.]